ncbi:MbnP family protein [Adhaeribacter terreus]|uniref:MbnP family protein n=1 Tax=Adhaeribacter terreus TaxID=529703 RepID=A0ABW0EE71_9BACT
MKFTNRISRFLAFVLPLSFAIAATSCDNDDDDKKATPKPAEPVPAQLHVNFDHQVNGQPLEFNTREYTNAAGNTYNVTLLKYYISNVTLTNSETGEVFKEKDSYHLINPTESKSSFTLKDLPSKKFDHLSFAIGIDSAANLSTDQPGDLNPNNDMAWNWNTGYVFVKFEGNNIKPNAADNRAVLLHVGHNANYKTVTFPINGGVTFAADRIFNANLRVDANALLEGPNVIDFNTLTNVMGGPNAAKIAENYSDGMFSLHEVKQQ